MSWVTVIFSMTASACLTMALLYGLIWWRRRESWAHLLFALAALGTAAGAAGELAVMRSESPAQFVAAIGWEHLAAWVTVLALAGFVRLYLRAGRTWLLWTVCGLRSVSLLLNLWVGQNRIYRDITSLPHSSFLGESIAIVPVVANLWLYVGQLSLLALVIFVLDAALSAWRRGDRKVAVIVGGSIVFFVAAANLQAILIFWGYVQWPLTVSLFCLGIIAAMGYELGGEALRAMQLGRDLRASEERMTLAAEAANLGVWIREFASNEVWATDQWRTLFGFAKTEHLHHDTFLQRLHPQDRNITESAMAKATQGDGRYLSEYRILLPDGGFRWIASQGCIEFDRHGQPLRLQGVSLDITARKLAELEAQSHRNEVAHLLRAASLGELSSALAHELNQPLAAIMSNAQAALLFLAREKFNLDEIREILRDIVSDDKRAGEVIKRLRALLMKGEFKPQTLQANELIQEVLKLMHYDLTARAMQVATEFSPGLPTIRGDRVQLQQVLINLILNAGDAMSQPHNARRLTLRSNRVGGNVVQISVADTGSGIAPGDEERIFEPYHTTKAQGLGLGLSLSRTIVMAHGGRLWAENQATGGAAFHCTIPEWKGQ
jgi:two-component system, LuxR family, sensor kinase FixL